MIKTQQLALAAQHKAESMGWETRITLDQSDVVDLATVIAWAPGATQARYISFMEGSENCKGWVSVKHMHEKLAFWQAL
jgi:hypothetical protein